jgi:hypothetical protein
VSTTTKHRMTWYVYAGRERIRHQASMRGTWGYDVTCSCGEFETHTGGATLGYIRGEVWLHKVLAGDEAEGGGAS